VVVEPGHAVTIRCRCHSSGWRSLYAGAGEQRYQDVVAKALPGAVGLADLHGAPAATGHRSGEIEQPPGDLRMRTGRRAQGVVLLL
jgi:hypothetical protein